MEKEKEIRLSAFLDGELPQAEAVKIREDLQEDAEGRAFLARLEALRGSSREAHRTTARPDWASVRNRVRRGDPALTRWNYFTYHLASGLVATLLFGLLLFGPTSAEKRSKVLFGDRVEMVETDLEGATPVVFLDEPSGWTVVWVLEEELPSEG